LSLNLNFSSLEIKRKESGIYGTKGLADPCSSSIGRYLSDHLSRVGEHETPKNGVKGLTGVKGRERACGRKEVSEGSPPLNNNSKNTAYIVPHPVGVLLSALNKSSLTLLVVTAPPFLVVHVVLLYQEISLRPT